MGVHVSCMPCSPLSQVQHCPYLGMSSERWRRLHLLLPPQRAEDAQAPAPGGVVPQHAGEGEGPGSGAQLHGRETPWAHNGCMGNCCRI